MPSEQLDQLAIMARKSQEFCLPLFSEIVNKPNDWSTGIAAFLGKLNSNELKIVIQSSKLCEKMQSSSTSMSLPGLDWLSNDDIAFVEKRPCFDFKTS